MPLMVSSRNVTVARSFRQVAGRTVLGMVSRLATLALLLALASCTADSEPERGRDDPSQSPTDARRTDTQPTDAQPPEPEPTEPDPTESLTAAQPLVLAVHATRSLRDVPTPSARELVRNGGSRWSQIRQAGGRMRVVTGGLPAGASPVASQRSAAAALRRVHRDPATLALVPASTVDARVRVLSVGGVHPLRSPELYPLEVPAAAGPGRVTTLAVMGDVMLGRRVGDRLEAVDDPAAVFRPLGRRLSAAHVTVANLESTLSDDGEPTQGDDSFYASPDVRAGLRVAGIDVLSLANNHVGDYGPTALRQTLRLLSGFEAVGAGRNLREARRPVIVDRDGVRIGFLATDSIGESPAATRRTPGTNRLDMPPRTGPLDRVALARVAGDVRRLAGQVDTVVVLPHWGEQYTHVPEPSQRRVARVLARSGADLVLGGHPHWVQGWEPMPGADGEPATVVHSLGNFVFDMDFMEQTQQGVFVEVVLWDGRVMAVEPVPYVIGPDFTPRAVSGSRGEAILADVWSTSRGPWSP
jgi:poly-gamma-glutamate synthesis protein (capsule biosynthesis protein)